MGEREVWIKIFENQRFASKESDKNFDFVEFFRLGIKLSNQKQV